MTPIENILLCMPSMSPKFAPRSLRASAIDDYLIFLSLFFSN